MKELQAVLIVPETCVDTQCQSPLSFYDQITKSDKNSSKTGTDHTALLYGPKTDYAIVSKKPIHTKGQIDEVQPKAGTPVDSSTQDTMSCTEDNLGEPMEFSALPMTKSIAQRDDKILLSGCNYRLKHGAKAVVRPIAFKPVTPNPQVQTGSGPYTPMGYDEGYSSHDITGSGSHSGSTMSRESETYASPVSVRNQNIMEAQNRSDAVINLRELESIMLEKDAEMAKLREVMEHNEKAIIRVQEQRKRDWESQMAELAQEYHRRLNLQQDRARSQENDLRLVISKLESENQELQNEIRNNQFSKRKSNELIDKLTMLQDENNELGEKLAQASCENERLRGRVADLDENNKRLSTQLSLGHTEQRRLENQLSELKRNLTNHEHSSNNKLDRLRYEIRLKEQQIQSDKETFQREREQWQDEKNKVLQYQKQLQQTYVQMYRRNVDLERQLCRINSRRSSGRESTSSLNQSQMDRNSCLNMELESNPESFC